MRSWLISRFTASRSPLAARSLAKRGLAANPCRNISSTFSIARRVTSATVNSLPSGHPVRCGMKLRKSDS